MKASERQTPLGNCETAMVERDGDVIVMVDGQLSAIHHAVKQAMSGVLNFAPWVLGPGSIHYTKPFPSGVLQVLMEKFTASVEWWYSSSMLKRGAP